MTDSYEEALAEAMKLGLMTTGGEATNRCQCAECGEVFSTEGNFDKHLAPGRYKGGPWCREPSTVGLVRAERGWWHMPGRPPESLGQPTESPILAVTGTVGASGG